MENLSTLLLVSSIILSSMALYGVKKRSIPGAAYFAMLLFCMAIHSVGYAFELLGGTIERMYFFIRIEYLGISFLPLSIFLFSSRITDEKKIANNYTIFFIMIINFMTFIFVNTNDFHHLYYSSVNMYELSETNLLNLGKGPWYYVHTIMMTSCNLYGISVFLRKAFNSTAEYKKRALIMLSGTSIPLMTYFIYMLGLSPYGIDLLPFSYLVMSFLMGLGFFKYDILFLTPITHETIFNSIDEGVIVLDDKMRIVSLNEKVKDFFESAESVKIGDFVMEIKELERNDFSYDKKNFTIADKVYEIKIINIESKLIKILVIKDITESERIKNRLEFFATTDALTGIYNRGYFMNRFANECEGGSFAIIDIDHFKNINDRYGHTEGDKVLSYFGREIRKYFKDYMVCRYGGEEFAIYLEGASVEEAYEKIEDFRKKIVRKNREREIYFTFSSGISKCMAENKEESIIAADKKLYEAKESGRNKVKY